MYDRPDVPKGGAHTNVIAIVVLVVIAVAGVALVSTLWRLANKNTALGDKDLASAVSASTGSADTVAELGTSVGYVPTGDSLTTVLFVVTPDKNTGSLADLYLAVLNETKQTSQLVQVPVDARLQANGQTNSMATIYASGASASLAATISTVCGIPVSHVVVMSQSGWNAFADVAGQGASALAEQSDELVRGIVKSDLDTGGLLDLAKRALDTGLTKDAVAIPVAENADEGGAAVKEMLPSDVAIIVGALTAG